MARQVVEYRTGSKRETVYGKTVSEVREKLDRLTKNAKRLADPKKRLVRDFMADWLEMIRPTSETPKKPQVAYNTYTLRKKAVERIVEDAEFSRLALADLTEAHIDAFVSRLTAKNIGTRAVQVAFETLRAALNYARSKRLLVEDLFAYTTAPKHEAKRPKAWTPEDHAAFIDAVLRPFDEAAFRAGSHRRGLNMDRLVAAARREHLTFSTLFGILATTGMRSGEALGLKWSAVDLEGGFAQVETTLTRLPDEDGGHRLVATAPKTRESRRVVGLMPEIVDALTALQSLTMGEFVFSSSNGKPLERGNVARTFKRWCRRIGVPERLPHTLRGAVATAYAARSGNTLVLTKSLGWTDPKTAARFYTRPNAEIAGAFRETIRGVFRGVQTPSVVEKPLLDKAS